MIAAMNVPITALRQVPLVTQRARRRPTSGADDGRDEQCPRPRRPARAGGAARPPRAGIAAPGHEQGDEDDDQRDELGRPGLGQPGVLRGEVDASDCSMPMARPATTVEHQVLEAARPRAAASAGTTNSV